MLSCSDKSLHCTYCDRIKCSSTHLAKIPNGHGVWHQSVVELYCVVDTCLVAMLFIVTPAQSSSRLASHARYFCLLPPPLVALQTRSTTIISTTMTHQQQVRWCSSQQVSVMAASARAVTGAGYEHVVCMWSGFNPDYSVLFQLSIPGMTRV